MEAPALPAIIALLIGIAVFVRATREGYRND